MKKTYVKPAMLAEVFVATQSVASNCFEIIGTYKPYNIKENDASCSRLTCDKGHVVSKDVVTTYDKYTITIDEKTGLISSKEEGPDNFVTVFTSNYSCEMQSDSFKDLKSMCQAINGNSTWVSGEHGPALGDLKLPS